MKIFGFLVPYKKNIKDEKIFMVPNPVTMRFSRRFLKSENRKIRQAYIGGEDFGLHRAGIKHIIAVCNVQRCPQRMYCFDKHRNYRPVAIIPVHTIQQKRN